MDLAQAQITGSGTNYRVSYGDDKGLLVEFVDDAIEQPFETQKHGRAIYKQVPFISILFPGDKTKKTYRPATEADKARFPQQWAFFEKGTIAGVQGTLITQWNYLSKSQAMELKHMGFWTVELLANASDTQISSFLGGMELRKQAQVFLQSTEGNSTLTALVAENEQLKSSVKTLQDQMQALIEQNEANKSEEAVEPRKPGRPPKHKEEN